MKRVFHSPASSLERYHVMTMGSPEACAASAPRVEEMNAICLLSGDQVSSLPVPGSGLLVPLVEVRKAISDPSGRATNSPLLSSCLPSKASHLPSGDHSGLPLESFSPPIREDFCVARSISQS